MKLSFAILKNSVWTLLICITSIAQAHDTWVQTNTNVVRVEDAVHVDLMLGNHGNDHRDFKLAGKPDIQASTLEIILPDGKRFDLKERVNDVGYAPTEGFLSARFTPQQAGLYLVSHTFDKVMSYAPVRAIKSAKTCFIASSSLDNVARDQPGFDRALGHPFELVFTKNPVAPMGPGTPISVRLLYEGKPVPNARVSYIPRGTELTADFDKQFERTTDAAGEASFTPTIGNYYLIIAHREEPQQRGTGYDRTKYSAALCVFVPQICPCCLD